ncbi:MAG TPA: glycosyltransferase family 39 protein, partial [Gemmataceae bacterium]|nr:glycosyltransferase family 39 protein [Gemmataceae bacterium]
RVCDNRAGHYALLLTAGAALFLLNLGGATLWDVDEGKNSTASRIMLESGDYIVPYFNGELRVDKPALLYWLQVGAYRLFGINEFSARLPSAVAALLTVLLCYELGRQLFSPSTGMLAGLILASTPMLAGAARFANPDALLNFLTVLTLFVFWRGLAAPNWFWYVAMGVTSGLAVLAKGPVGVVLPTAVIGLFLLWYRRLRIMINVRFLLSFLAFCLVGLPWYILVGMETRGDFLRGFFLQHNLERALSTMENHGGSVLYYPLVLFAGFAPWSLFLPLAFWYCGWSMIKKPWSRFACAWSRAADQAGRMEDPKSILDPRSSIRQSGYRFLCCWIGVYLVFFTVAATKLPNYILPIAVPTALLIGRFLDRWRQGLVQTPLWIMQLALGGVAMIGLCIGLGMLLLGGAVRFPFMHDHYVPGMEWWAVMGLVPGVGVFLAWRRLQRQNATGVIVCLATAIFAFFVPMAAWATATLNRHKAPRPLVEQAGALVRDKEIRIGCFHMEYLPSLNFYCQRDVIHHEDVPHVVDFLRYSVPVFLFVPENDWVEIEKSFRTPHRVVARHYDLYHAYHVVVVSNQP